MMRPLRWWPLLLVPSGFVAGHELGYQAATALGRAPVPGGHDYLGGLALVGAPFAFAAVARSLVAGLRDELPTVRWSTLAGAQVALFLAVELTEHAAAGLTPVATLAEPAVLLGLAAQLAVAAALVRLVRTSHEVGAALAAARRRGAPAPVARPVPGGGAVPLPLAVPVSSLSRRGPPPARAR
ncbi:MAG: hypothetical protein C0P77_007030 [Thermoanaerobacterales bacterium]